MVCRCSFNFPTSSAFCLLIVSVIGVICLVTSSATRVCIVPMNSAMRSRILCMVTGVVSPMAARTD
eukprot:3208591-Pyramimonas_sp.AAC.1